MAICFRCREKVIDGNHVCPNKAEPQKSTVYDLAAGSSESPAQAKREQFLAWLDLGVTMLHLDPRRAGVEVPLQFKADSSLRLNFSYRYKVADFAIGQDGVIATLGFAGKGHRCVIPWSAVFAVTNAIAGKGRVWQDDMPEEVRTAAGLPPR